MVAGDAVAIDRLPACTQGAAQATGARVDGDAPVDRRTDRRLVRGFRPDGREVEDDGPAAAFGAAQPGPGLAQSVVVFVAPGDDEPAVGDVVGFREVGLPRRPADPGSQLRTEALVEAIAPVPASR